MEGGSTGCVGYDIGGPRMKTLVITNITDHRNVFALTGSFACICIDYGIQNVLAYSVFALHYLCGREARINMKCETINKLTKIYWNENLLPFHYFQRNSLL